MSYTSWVTRSSKRSNTTPGPSLEVDALRFAIPVTAQESAVFAAIRALALAFAIAVSGCAATVGRPTTEQRPLTHSGPPKMAALLITGSPATQASADWHTFRAEWRTAFASAASAGGLQFVYLDSDSSEQPPGTVLVRVSVSDYRYLTSGARYGFGVMTGNAYINADAEFFEFPGRRSIGTRKYSTSSSAWEGIFSAMTDKQVMAISNAMIQDLKSR
jgi:hypothetical protein